MERIKLIKTTVYYDIYKYPSIKINDNYYSCTRYSYSYDNIFYVNKIKSNVFLTPMGFILINAEIIKEIETNCIELEEQHLIKFNTRDESNVFSIIY